MHESATTPTGEPAVTHEEFIEMLCESRHMLAFRLSRITKDWGPLDFPHDKGTAIRNHLFIYGDSFVGLMNFHLAPRSIDQWVKMNFTHLAKLNPEQSLRLMGLCCFHAQLFQFHGRFSLRYVALAPGSALSLMKDVEAWCNWMYSAYDLPSDCASAWHQIITATAGHSPKEYVERSVATFSKYLEMLTPLGGTPAGDAWVWAGTGLHADLETRKQTPEWIADASEKYFRENL